jgi:hypothetical protein
MGTGCFVASTSSTFVSSGPMTNAIDAPPGWAGAAMSSFTARPAGASDAVNDSPGAGAAAWPVPEALHTGVHLGPYEILERVGAGGMGTDICCTRATGLLLVKSQTFLGVTINGTKTRPELR